MNDSADKTPSAADVLYTKRLFIQTAREVFGPEAGAKAARHVGLEDDPSGKLDVEPPIDFNVHDDK